MSNETTARETSGRSRRLSIAIVAMGGQGGGVLSDWLRSTAEAGGWTVQTTSVPGVAQRTGATIYYVELFQTTNDESAPVLALMPVAGDVDLVIAAEWLETGRAIMRGLVTPDRTTLVASTHRSYATSEKLVPGDGRADSESVHAAAAKAARKLVAFDMARVAEDNGSVISASLLGAVAASGALPFEVSHYETAIREGGVGVERSLAAFHAAHQKAGELSAGTPVADTPDHAELPGFRLQGALGDRIRQELPEQVWSMAGEGVRRCIDYMDADYAGEYLDRIGAIGGVSSDVTLLTELCRWLALRMCYEDPFRVADLKTRGTRFTDIRQEVNASERQVIHHTEFLHPRVEEIADSLPASTGQRLLDSPRLRAWVDRLFGHGRRIRTSSVTGYLMLHLVASRGKHRRATLRHQHETAWMDNWLKKVADVAGQNPGLATAIVRLARLIKGYSDTHTRAQATYSRLFSIADGLIERSDGGKILDELIDAALSDATGQTLDARIAGIDARPTETIDAPGAAA